MTEGAEPADVNSFLCARYINIGTGGADLYSSSFLPRLVGWVMDHPGLEQFVAGELLATSFAVPLHALYCLTDVREPIMIAPQRGAASPRIRLRMRGLIPPSDTTYTRIPSRSSSSTSSAA